MHVVVENIRILCFPCYSILSTFTNNKIKMKKKSHVSCTHGKSKSAFIYNSYKWYCENVCVCCVLCNQWNWMEFRMKYSAFSFNSETSYWLLCNTHSVWIYFHCCYYMSEKKKKNISFLFHSLFLNLFLSINSLFITDTRERISKVTCHNRIFVFKKCFTNIEIFSL